MEGFIRLVAVVLVVIKGEVLQDGLELRKKAGYLEPGILVEYDTGH